MRSDEQFAALGVDIPTNLLAVRDKVREWARLSRRIARTLAALPGAAHRVAQTIGATDFVDLDHRRTEYSCIAARTATFGWRIVPPITRDLASPRLK